MIKEDDKCLSPFQLKSIRVTFLQQDCSYQSKFLNVLTDVQKEKEILKNFLS